MKRIMTREEYDAAIGVSSEKKKIMTREEYDAAIGISSEKRKIMTRAEYDEARSNAELKKQYSTFNKTRNKESSTDRISLLNVDTDALQNEIGALSSRVSAAQNVQSKLKEIDIGARKYEKTGAGARDWTKSKSVSSETDRLKYDKNYGDLKLQAVRLGDVDSLNKELAQKKAYLNQAKIAQSWAKLTDDAVNADDFNDRRKYTAPDGNLPRIFDSDALEYDFINNQGGVREADESENLRSGVRSERLRKNYHKIYDDERDIYNYYYSLDKENGTDLRHEYLDSIQQTLNQRAASDRAEALEGHHVLEAGVNIFNNAEDAMNNIGTAGKNAIGGIFFDSLDPDYIPISEQSYLTSYISNDMHEAGKAWGVVSDLSSNLGNMLPSIAAGVLSNAVIPGSGAYVQSTLMGLGAGGQAYQEAINSGYDKKAARIYGGAIAATETAFEKFLGGIVPYSGGEGLSGVITKFAKDLDNAYAAFALKWAGSAIGEFPEEYLQEWLEPKIKNAILHADEPENAFFSTENLYAGLLGFVSGLILDSGNAIVDTRNSIDIGKNIKNTPEGISDLVKVGNTMPLDSAAHKIISKINNESSAYHVGQAFIEAGATVSEQNYKDIVDGLVEVGYDKKDAKRVARTFAKYLYDSSSLTELEKQAIELSSSPLMDVIKKKIVGKNTTVYQRAEAYYNTERRANGEFNSEDGWTALNPGKTGEDAWAALYPDKKSVEAKTELNPGKGKKDILGDLSDQYKNPLAPNYNEYSETNAKIRNIQNESSILKYYYKDLSKKSYGFSPYYAEKLGTQGQYEYKDIKDKDYYYDTLKSTGERVYVKEVVSKTEDGMKLRLTAEP